MDTMVQVMYVKCSAIMPPWYKGHWLKHEYGEAWQIDSPKPVTSSAMCLQGWKPQLDGCKDILCHMPLAGTIMDFKKQAL